MSVPHRPGTKPPTRNAVLCVLGAALACTAFGNTQTSDDTPANGAEAESTDLALELYASPYGTDVVTPIYPRSALDRSKEGLVRLDFMVDPDGRPYEIAVTESVGDEAFQRAAKRALAKSTFEPARFNGEPLDAGHYQYYHFEIDGNIGARSPFVRKYRRLMKAVGDGNREKADHLLDQLESGAALNLYEDAFLHVAKSGYYATWGDPNQQLEALNRAVGHYTAEKRLSKPLYVSLQRGRFLLLVQNQDFQRAMYTFETLADKLDEADLAPLQAVVDKLETLRLDDTPYTVPGDFGESFSWSYSLFKNEFFLDDVEGEIEEIKLRCAKKYVFLRFDPDLQYEIKQNYMPCRMQLIGDPGTTFTLTQM
ncbi:MAG: TonB family protein [Gammaproteobacteria bacterium]|nr:TonB family protein [Gammaproteobacteria bacterium]